MSSNVQGEAHFPGLPLANKAAVVTVLAEALAEPLLFDSAMGAPVAIVPESTLTSSTLPQASARRHESAIMAT